MNTYYVCTACNFNTNHLSKYNRHIITDKHLRRANIICKYCNEQFSTTEMLESHQNNECIEYCKAMIKELRKNEIENNDMINSQHKKITSQIEKI